MREILAWKGKLIIAARLLNHTYVVEEPDAIADSKPDNDAELWHCRLGHLNFQDMLKLKTVATGVNFTG